MQAGDDIEAGLAGTITTWADAGPKIVCQIGRFKFKPEHYQVAGLFNLFFALIAAGNSIC